MRMVELTEFAEERQPEHVFFCRPFFCDADTTVVPAMAGPLGERPPAFAGHFCNVPTTLPC